MILRMIRSNLKKLALLPSLYTFSPDDPDRVLKNTKTVQDADLDILKEETGWERLQQLFSLDDFGRLTPEVNTIIQVACMSSFIGGFYGGVLHSRESYIDFIKNNQATAFRDHMEAKKRLQDQVTMSFAKGAFKWAWRLTFFCTTYATVSTSVAAYRGKNGIVEHIIAGTIAGSSYKFTMGPRGWIVGGGLGAVLGIFAGLVTSSLLNITGMTMEEVRYWNYKWSSARSEAFNKEMKKHLEKEEIALFTEREAKVVNPDTNLNRIDLNVLENSDNVNQIK